VFEANIEVQKATQRFMKVKEFMQTSCQNIIFHHHSEMRNMRETLKGVFMSDSLVMSAIKTVKHQEKLFDMIYADFLESYRELYENTQKLRVIEDFLSQGFMNLSGISKLIYNSSMQEGQEFNIGGSTIDENVSRTRRMSKVSIGDEEEPTSTRRRNKSARTKRRRRGGAVEE